MHVMDVWNVPKNLLNIAQNVFPVSFYSMEYAMTLVQVIPIKELNKIAYTVMQLANPVLTMEKTNVQIVQMDSS